MSSETPRRAPRVWPGGLRVLLLAQKTMNRQGSMVVTNANESIMEIFEVTGFCDILTIE